MRSAVIATARFLIGHMSEMPLDDLSIPSQQLSNQRAGGSSETMPCDLLLGVIETLATASKYSLSRGAAALI